MLKQRKRTWKTDDQVALAIFDQFKGQVTHAVMLRALNKNNILYV